MDPETRKALDRAYRRELRSLWLWPLALIAVVGGLAAIWFMPKERVGVVTARLERFHMPPSDAGTLDALMLALPDGRSVRIEMRPGDAALAPGASVCVVELRHPILHRTSFVRVPDARCSEAEDT